MLFILYIHYQYCIIYTVIYVKKLYCVRVLQKFVTKKYNFQKIREYICMLVSVECNRGVPFTEFSWFLTGVRARKSKSRRHARCARQGH